MIRKRPTRKRPPHQRVCWIPRDERKVTSITSRKRGAKRAAPRRIPSIALSGEWLRRAGFPPGARILIMVQSEGQLIIDRLR